MSFLKEVLEVIGETDIINVNEKLPKITKEIEQLKVEVIDFMSDAYVDFHLVNNKNIILLSNANNLNLETKKMIEKIESQVKSKIADSTEDLEMLALKLQELNYSLNICLELLNIHYGFNDFDKYMKQADYNSAAKILRTIRDLLDHPSNDIEYLDIFIELQDICYLSEMELLKPQKEIWNSCVELTTDDKNASIQINSGRLDDIKQALNILTKMSNEVASEVEILSQFLMSEILEPIITQQCRVKNTDIDNIVILSVIKEGSQKMYYMEVFENIKNVFDFLSSTINFSAGDNSLLLGLVGKQIAKKFCDLLIKQCLVDTIPSTQEDMAKYDVVIKEVEILQDFLMSVSFLNDDDSIMEYANNIDVIFSNKLCQTYVNRAHIIMKKDLHTTTEVGDDKDGDIEPGQLSDLEYPKCQISRSVLELLDLIHETLDLATSTSEMCSGRLLVTAQNMFELYANYVPEYHRKFLDTIPQHVALFHNNCMYLAHSVRAICNEYENKLPKSLLPITFDDQFLVLKKTGSSVFLKHIDMQKKQILDIIGDSGLATLGQTTKLDSNTEKSIRQCLRQLELLQTVWRKVLPVNIYNKSLGILLNAFVQELINRVIVLEDISADTSTQLVNMYNLVKQRAPKVLTDQNEIHQYVKLWMKFNELIFVLNGSLVDIDGRWADGKGPLAIDFQPEELKSLIRALFQNSDRRAAILNKIKY